MQIDLFKSRRRMDVMSKCGGYVTNRQFKLDPSANLNKIYEMTNCRRNDVVEEYIDSIRRRISAGRHYDDVGSGVVCDNLFDIEALGIGAYASTYQIILSFEDCLDYFLHLACGCSMQAVRSINHYHEVSSAIMELRHGTRQQNVQFSVLFDIDDKLNRYFLSIYQTLKEKDMCSGDAFVDQLMCDIVLSILQIVHRVQDYIISIFAAKQAPIDNMVCRSRSFSSLIFTCPKPVTEDIILNREGYDSIVIKPRCYSKYEYAAKEVLICDNCRRC